MDGLLIIGTSSIQGGGKSILLNIDRALQKQGKARAYILVSNRSQGEELNSETLVLPTLGFIHPLIMTQLMLPYYKRRYKIKSILNLADVPLITGARQLFYLDWAFLVYDDIEIWRRMSLSSYARRRLKRILWFGLSGYIDHVFCQTKTMAERLKKVYSGQTSILPNASPGCGDALLEDSFPNSLKLIFLSNYYEHKNFELLLDILPEIVRNRLRITITLTLDLNSKTRDFLSRINQYIDLGVVINVGTVSYDEIGAVLQSHNGIFLPSLIESYSTNYIEASIYNLMIFTSDRDFARDVCTEWAYYFDPMNSISVLECFMAALNAERIYSGNILRSNPASSFTWSDYMLELNEHL